MYGQLFVIGWKCAAATARTVFELDHEEAGPFLNTRVSLSDVAHFLGNDFADLTALSALYQPGPDNKNLPSVRKDTKEGRLPYQAKESPGGRMATVFHQACDTFRLRHQFKQKEGVLTNYTAMSAKLNAGAERLKAALHAEAPVLLVHFVWDPAEYAREIAPFLGVLERKYPHKDNVRVIAFYQPGDIKGELSLPAYPRLHSIGVTQRGLKSTTPNRAFQIEVAEHLIKIGAEVGFTDFPETVVSKPLLAQYGQEKGSDVGAMIKKRERRQHRPY